MSIQPHYIYFTQRLDATPVLSSTFNYIHTFSRCVAFVTFQRHEVAPHLNLIITWIQSITSDSFTQSAACPVLEFLEEPLGNVRPRAAPPSGYFFPSLCRDS